MIFKKKILFVTLVAILAGFTTWKIYNQRRIKKYNILIVSTCSLRYSRLGYNGGARSPNIDALALKSFIFDNAITDMSWSNASGFLSRLTKKDFKNAGYHAIGNPWNLDESNWQQLGRDIPEYYFRTPASDRDTREKLSFFEDDLEEVKRRVLNKQNWPFVLDLHIKVMHLPYGGSFNKKLTHADLKLRKSEKPIPTLIAPLAEGISGMENALIPEIFTKSKRILPVRYMTDPLITEYVREYERDFMKYPERIPFSIFLGLRRKDFKKEIVKMLNIDESIAGKMNSRNIKNMHYIGILNNRKVLDRWKKSPFFEEDLETIKEIYDKRLKIYDESLKNILSFYGDKDFEKETVIIFTGDHGEAFFEHGYMIHGETVFDEMIKFPLFIKFPGQSKGEKISSQFFQQGVADVVEKIMTGELNQGNFRSFVETKVAKDFIYSRNCANDMHSLRFKNKWKLMVDLKRGKKYLFDLVNDPKELSDVYDKQPNEAVFLEENYDEALQVQSQNKMIHYCAPGSDG